MACRKQAKHKLHEILRPVDLIPGQPVFRSRVAAIPFEKNAHVSNATIKSNSLLLELAPLMQELMQS